MNNDSSSSEQTDNSSLITHHSEEPVIRLANISKKYNLYNSRQDRLKEALHPRRKKYHKEFYALSDINLEVKKGEILGIVGKNGSGKSTLLKIISNILTPSSGSVEVKGKVVPLLELGAGFNPEFTGMENIYFYCSLLGYTRKQTEELVPDIIEFAEIEDFINQPIKTYSSGMKARLGFAVSVNVDPDILILDEVLAVGDELFRRKCFAKMEEFFKGGKTVLFVSHSANSINELCTRAILLDRGECILDGPAKMVTMYYQKMLFADKNKNDVIRREILELDKNESLKQEIFQNIKNNEGKKNKSKSNKNIYKEPTSESILNLKTKDEFIQKAYYNPNLKPKSTVICDYTDIDILEIKILDKQNNKVNILCSGEIYIFSYTVLFNYDASKVGFNMLVKEIKGSTLSGSKTCVDSQFLIDVKKGDKLEINWEFTNIFNKGDYYLNLGITQGNHREDKLLYRIIDAYMFRVQENTTFCVSGFSTMFQKPVINNLGRV